MVDRAQRGGGVAAPLSTQAGGFNVGGPNAQAGIVRGSGADWFGPGNPLRPVAPAEVRGRTFDFAPAVNMIQTPRKNEAISPTLLRGLARGYDVLTTVIETRKDQVAGLKWSIGSAIDKEKLTPEQVARAERVTTFFKRPQTDLRWSTWIRKLLDDLFILDAPTIYPRMTRGGDLFELVIFDGGTINRIVDDWGRTPDAPAPAYQQILRGLAAVDYTAEELIYRPRNPRPDKIFGFGPVEQIVAIINIAIRREGWQLKFFTEGSLPDALVGTPAEWTPDQVRSFQNWFDAVQQSDTGGTRGVRFVPGGITSSYVATKQAELFGAAEEWLARVICFAFSISPQAFVKMMNRATGETQREIAIEEGLEPLKNWLKELLDDLIARFFKSPDLAFHWNEQDEIDQVALSALLINEVEAGLRSIDEARPSRGLDPLGGDFAQPMVKTPTGYVPIDFETQMAQAERRQELAPPDPAPGDPGGDPNKPPGDRQSSKGQGSAKGSSGDDGKDKSGSVDKSLPPAFTKAVGDAITCARPIARRSFKRVKAAAENALRETGRDVAKEVAGALKHALRAHKVAKAVDDNNDGLEGQVPLLTASEIASLVKQLDLSSLDLMVDATDAALFDLASDSAMKAIASVGVRDKNALFDRVHGNAVDWAHDRAAELVGKRWAADGTLIDNPSPRWAIDQSTRDMVRGVIARGLDENIGTPAIADRIAAITDELSGSFMFGEERATIIANTEVRRSNEQGKLIGWRASEDAGLSIQKVWLTAQDSDVDEDVCEPNGEQGPIDLDADFESGDDAPPGHPNCRCTLDSVVTDTAVNDQPTEDPNDDEA